jgi:hypothetical protein
VYRIVLPDSFRGREVALNVRAIGFRQSSRTVTLSHDTTTVDFALAVDANRLSEVVVAGVSGTTGVRSLGFTVAGTAPGGVALQDLRGRYRRPDNTESYDRIVDNPFLGARDNPLHAPWTSIAPRTQRRRFVRGPATTADAVRTRSRQLLYLGTRILMTAIRSR